jgi:hypothetical protein
MSAQIEVVNEAAFPLDEARLKAVAARVLQQEKAASDAALTIVISNDESVA